LIATGHIGLVAFSGASMSGNALYYLTNENVQNLSFENKLLASKILLRKSKLTYPCNLSLTEADKLNLSKSDYYQECWNTWHMTSWLEVIKLETSKEPFAFNDNRNLEPWRHMNLSIFFTSLKDNNSYDKKLSNLSLEVFKLNKKKIFNTILKSPITFVQTIYPHIKKLLFLYFFIFIVYLIAAKVYKKKIIIFNQFGPEEKILISVILFQILNCIILFGFHSGEVRSLSINSFLFIPSIMSYFIFVLVNKK
jgi:hypothetical protein